MADLQMIESFDIEHFTQLLEEYGLPSNTPQDLVVSLLECLEEQGIDPGDVHAVENELSASALWVWVQGEHIEFNEHLPIESLARRVATLFGV